MPTQEPLVPVPVFPKITSPTQFGMVPVARRLGYNGYDNEILGDVGGGGVTPEELELAIEVETTARTAADTALDTRIVTLETGGGGAAPYPLPVVAFTDDFDRPNSAIVGNGSTQTAPSGGPRFAVQNGKLLLTPRADDDFVRASLTWPGPTGQEINDEEINEMQVDAGEWVDGTNFSMGFLARIQSSSQFILALVYDGGTSVVSGSGLAPNICPATNRPGGFLLSSGFLARMYVSRSGPTTVRMEVCDLAGVPRYATQGRTTAYDAPGDWGLTTWGSGSLLVSRVSRLRQSGLYGSHRHGSLGDSRMIGQGVGTTTDLGLAICNRLTLLTGTQWTDTNRGIGATWTTNYLGDDARIVDAMAAFRLARVEDLSIGFGANDGNASQRLPPPEYQANVLTLANRGFTNGAKRVHLHAPYAGDFPVLDFDAATNSYYRLYAEALAEICNGTTILPGDFRSYDRFLREPGLVPDKIHADAAGTLVVAGHASDAMYRNLRRLGVA